MFEKFLEEIEISRERKTFLQYRRILQIFDGKEISIETVKEIMAMDISMNTKKQYLSTWIRALKFNGIECSSVAKFVKNLRTQEKANISPEKDDVEHVITFIKDPKIKLAVGLMSYAGLRINEVTGIIMEDVDLKNNRFVIRQTKNHTDRVCCISPKLRKLFLYWLNSSQRQKRGVFLFNSPRGDKYSTSYFKDAVKKWCKKLGHEHLHCHAFRHYFATNFYQSSGSNIALTAKACGHKSINTTMKYIATSVSDMASVVNKI